MSQDEDENYENDFAFLHKYMNTSTDNEENDNSTDTDDSMDANVTDNIDNFKSTSSAEDDDQEVNASDISYIESDPHTFGKQCTTGEEPKSIQPIELNQVKGESDTELIDDNERKLLMSVSMILEQSLTYGNQMYPKECQSQETDGGSLLKNNETTQVFKTPDRKSESLKNEQNLTSKKHKKKSNYSKSDKFTREGAISRNTFVRRQSLASTMDKFKVRNPSPIYYSHPDIKKYIAQGAIPKYIYILKPAMNLSQSLNAMEEESSIASALEQFTDADNEFEEECAHLKIPTIETDIALFNKRSTTPEESYYTHSEMPLELSRITSTNAKSIKIINQPEEMLQAQQSQHTLENPTLDMLDENFQPHGIDNSWKQKDLNPALRRTALFLLTDGGYTRTGKVRKRSEILNSILLNDLEQYDP